MTLPSDDEAVLTANERTPRAGIFSGLHIVQSWRCRCGDDAGGYLGDASPPGWKQVRCGFAGEVWLCPTCLEERSQRAREGAATRARRKRGELWKAPASVR